MRSYSRTGLVGVVLVALLCSACADVRSVSVASSTERAAARDLVIQLGALTSQPGGQSQLAQAIDTRAISVLLGTASALPETPSPASKDGDTPDLGTLGGCLIAADTSATLTECKLTGQVVDGIWSAQGSRIHADLIDVFMAGAEQHGSVTLGADLFRAVDSSGQITGLTGSMDIGMTWTADSRDYFLDASVRADGLALDGPGCATGGSVVIAGKLGDATLGPITLVFGPGCQDLQINR